MSDFHRLLEAEIPGLRRYAKALARSFDRVDDLVQDCLARALSKQHLWQPGTDLRAWLFTILHNQHVNIVRRMVREGASVSIADMDLAHVLSAKPDIMGRLELRDLEEHLRKLPQEQYQTVMLIGYEGLRYEEVASILHVPVGTVRSRLSRGRELLRRLLKEREPSKAQVDDFYNRPEFYGRRKEMVSAQIDGRMSHQRVNGHQSVEQESATLGASRKPSSVVKATSNGHAAKAAPQEAVAFQRKLIAEAIKQHDPVGQAAMPTERRIVVNQKDVHAGSRHLRATVYRYVYPE